MKVTVIEYNIRNGSFPWQISISVKFILEHLSLDLTVFKILTFQNVWLWKCMSKLWCTTFTVTPFDGQYMTSYMMAIVVIAFFQPIIVKQLLEKFDLECLGQGHWIQHSQLCRSMANINLHKSHTERFCDSSYCLRDIFLNIWLWKFMSRSHGRKMGLTTLDTEYQPLKLYRRIWALLASCHVFQMLYIYIVPEIVLRCKYRSRSRCTTFAAAPFDD